MNRLSKTLKKINDEEKKALVAYLVAGDPDLEITKKLLNLFVDSGVDIIEIGVPFTDPIAEGPIIQKAHDRALKSGTSLKKIFEMVEDFRKTNLETPIILMGYLNTFVSNKELIEKNNGNIIDSILVVDVPGELSLKDYDICNDYINTISLISPTTKQERVELIAQNSTGFVYYVTLRGVTGSSNINISEIKNNIQNIQKFSSVPTLAGFGIKTPDDARELSKCSDGVIIGSSIVEMISRIKEKKDFDTIGIYLKEIKQAIS